MAILKHNPLIMIVVGEASGDNLGAKVIHHLKNKFSGQVRFCGVGGEQMLREGFESLFSIHYLSLMGLFEIFPKLPRLYDCYKKVIEEAETLKPDLILTIDAPDFNFRVGKKLHSKGFSVVHFTAPTVWAWRPGRAKKIARFLSHLFLLYKFEKPYFDTVRLPNTFVGHPLIEDHLAEIVADDSFIKKYDLPPSANLVCLLTGSRRSELKNLLPVFKAALEKLSVTYPDLFILVPAAPDLEEQLQVILKDWSIPFRIITGRIDKFKAMKASKAALAASGTVTLELALLGVPTVVGYIMNPLTLWIGRLLIRTKWISLPNILLSRPVVPELIQNDCTVQNVADHLYRLLTNPEEHARMIQAFADLQECLKSEEGLPSELVADKIIELIHEKKA